MKERTFLLLIGIMTCFLDSPLVVILIHGLGLFLAIDNIVYLIDLMGIEGWEHFLNFQNF